MYDGATAPEEAICYELDDGTSGLWASGYGGHPCRRAVQRGLGGVRHSCGVRVDGAVVCWGLRRTPARRAGGTVQRGVRRIFSSCVVFAEWTHGCVLGMTRENERVQTRRAARQLDVPAGRFGAVSAGGSHSCGLRVDGAVVCWGDNEYGQADAPAGVFSAVSASGNFSCGVRVGGAVACWERELSGPPGVPAGEFSDVSAGRDHACGLRVDGTVACWGHNGDGQTDAPAGAVGASSSGSNRP